MSNAISTAIFCARGCDKTFHDNSARAIPTTGQAVNLMRKVSIFDNAFGTSAKTAVEAFETAKNATGLTGFAARGADFVARNVNPAIGVATGIKILCSKDKEKSLMTDGVGFLGMLAGEEAARHIIKTYGWTMGKTIVHAAKALGCTSPQASVAIWAAEGLLFAGASIGAWIGAAKLGGMLHDKIKNEGKDEASAKDESQKQEETTKDTVDGNKIVKNEPSAAAQLKNATAATRVESNGSTKESGTSLPGTANTIPA